jgi:hypothetical protein
MRVDDDPAGRAMAAWNALPAKQRREVDRQARRRRRHPDPRVAAVAAAWAEVIVARQVKRGRLGNAVIGLSGPSFSDIFVSDLRLARKVLLVAAPHGEP